jgi:hypothetical protein
VLVVIGAGLLRLEELGGSRGFSLTTFFYFLFVIIGGSILASLEPGLVNELALV